MKMKGIASMMMGTILCVACNSKSLVKEEPVQAVSSAGQSCYLYLNNKDTVKMTLTFDHQSVSGELTYNIFEKDGNTGTLRGAVVGDTIYAEYSFQSEGVTSVRDVAFLKKDSTLVEGFAPMDTSGTRFANRAELDFSGIVLKPTKCYE
ncbi:hypothetical protein [Pseudochryseolinea flava]|uniref:Uncharacterized protein n=1 Tax=Pseudochryseolinea flava TaxID=2059302 RepID=A0A364XZD0_9BACT|nr:hypothetical protein [Pseudochryseolinea flava]RAV98956.1 hypothetical protein DQQ10_21920 [Pseudochryseolinea flava]